MTSRVTRLTGIHALPYYGCEAVLVDPVRYQDREVSGPVEGGAAGAHEATVESEPEKAGEREASKAPGSNGRPQRKRGRPGPRRRG